MPSVQELKNNTQNSLPRRNGASRVQQLTSSSTTSKSSHFQPESKKYFLHFKFITWLGILLFFIMGYYSYVYYMKDIEETQERVQKMMTQLDNAIVSLKKEDPTVYLVWTTSEDSFTFRHQKIVDSYFCHHPGAKIVVFATQLNQTMFSSYTNAGYHLEVRPITDTILLDMAKKGCPGESWLQNLEEHKRGQYFYSHLTDFIRFCILYLEGGIYSDFDAILLNQINEYESFIGRDSSGANGKCEWCLPGGDAYLAPGLMGTKKGSPVAFSALKIGFDSDNYDPDIFNSVGPMAVTKAYRKIVKGINLLDRHILYPYSHTEAWRLMQSNIDAPAILKRLKKSSLSLHLYGHKTRKLPIEDNSIAALALNEMTVVETYEPVLNPISTLQVVCPHYFGIENIVKIIPGLRLKWYLPSSYSSESFNQQLEWTITVKSGFLHLANMSQTQFQHKRTLVLTANNPAEMNQKLSQLVYISPSYEQPNFSGRDFIISKLRVNNNTIDACHIKVYDIPSMVTIIVKTFGRMEKVFNLLDSVKKLYPTIRILVADDGESTVSPTNSLGFSYYSLPYDTGLSGGRNFLVDRVTTEFFLTLDDDFTMDEKSSLEDIIYVVDQKLVDIAAGKNPRDEDKFELDFCGLMKIQDRTLFLLPGDYGLKGDCRHVDFVPNLFVARTKLFQSHIRWDPKFKLGEHEDFFLRAKQHGLKVGSCSSTSFNHDQVEHWLRRTKYDEMRGRVFHFWQDSLRKHGLLKLVSFNKTMMDLEVPAPPTNMFITERLGYSLCLNWETASTASVVALNRDLSNTFYTANYGVGMHFPGTRLVVYDLTPGEMYSFRIFASNGFIQEKVGLGMIAATRSNDEIKKINLLQNGDFEKGHFGWKADMSSHFHIIGIHNHTSEYVGRTQVLTRGYRSLTPTVCSFSQVVFLNSTTNSKVDPIYNIVLGARSRVEALYHQQFEWKLVLTIYFSEKNSITNETSSTSTPLTFEVDFDGSNHQWQAQSIRVALTGLYPVEKIVVRAKMSMFRGTLLWDDFILLVNDVEDLQTIPIK